MRLINRVHSRRVNLAAWLGCAFCMAAATPLAHAQWTIIVLHPAGATNSEARGVYSGQQGGVVDANTANGGAVVWNGSAATARSLNPVVLGQPSTDRKSVV